ncbi:MAG TPA: hypothetical protein VMU56_03175 [Beijerinckiaceae bacterium]|nr:hypothetical protein [Beijerinckiaceae bacterium]
MSRRWCAVIVVALGVSGQAIAKEPVIACPSGKAAVVKVSREFGNTPGARPTIKVLAGTADDTRIVTILGPVFGTMDSPDVQTDLACDASGIALTETITRSDQFYGAAAKNVPWSPMVKLAVTLKAASTELTVRWDVRLSNGKAFDAAHAWAGDHYPVVVTQTIHR